MNKKIVTGTSGWHYNHWLGLFYPKNVTGYEELRFYSHHFDTVENNSSFYRIAGEPTYKTWYRMTNKGFLFSMKLNKLITHTHRLDLNDEVKEKIQSILETTQVLEEKLGAIVIQLPPSFKYDLEKLKKFLVYFMKKISLLEFKFDVAVEFRNKEWFRDEVYKFLIRKNVALVAASSSRYPGVRELTADFAYVRLHGPKELFSSKYSQDEIKELSTYLKKISKKTKKIYVYFNNDFHGYALDNAKELKNMLSS